LESITIGWCLVLKSLTSFTLCYYSSNVFEINSYLKLVQKKKKIVFEVSSPVSDGNCLGSKRTGTDTRKMFLCFVLAGLGTHSI
jgi:hypothetical protein